MALWLALAVTTLPGHVAHAQRFTDSDDSCRDQNWGNDRAGFCEVRDLTMPASGSLEVDATPNGGIHVAGAARYDVQVRARVVATAASEARAREIAAAVQIQPSGDRLRAEGPSGLARRESWHVSYDLAVPMQMSLTLKSTNGGVSVRDVEGRLDLSTTNGGIKLANVGGDVRGRTTNGGVDVELDGVTWRGEGLDVQTTNGGVRLTLPEGYSATLQAATNNGGMTSDFPMMVRGRLNRDVEATLGGGGAPIRVRTSNGGVRIMRK
jgi:hypothetical protein